MPIPDHNFQEPGGALSKKNRLLLVSFSESETAFLSRAARILSGSGDWDCNFLILHELAKDNPIVADFDALGIGFYANSEWQFYGDYSNNEPIPVLNKYDVWLIEWLREQKNRRPFVRIFFPFIWAALFIVSLLARFIPWILKYGMMNAVRKVNQKLKQFLRLNHPRIHDWLRKNVAVLRSFWYQIPRKTFIRFLRSKHPKLYKRLKAISFALKSGWYATPWISEYYLNMRAAHEVSRLTGYVDAASRFFAELAPDGIILAKDSAYYSTTTFIKAARNLGIFSVVIPYDRADSETLAKDRVGQPAHAITSQSAKEVAKKFPSWVYFHHSEALLLVEPSTVYAVEKLNLAPPNPWGYNNSLCDRIFLETEEDRQLFLQSGALPDQLVVVGAPYMDKLDEMFSQRSKLRDQLCSSFGFHPDKPFVIASVPPNKVSQRSNEIEFQNYHSLLEKWSSALVQGLDCNLVYSLHPLTKPFDVAFMEKTGGKILQRPLEELLAVADLYVVDCSSTARWARYVGLDVIDYDVYRYNLWFNSAVEGVRHVTSYAQFLAELVVARERLHRQLHQAPRPEHESPNQSFGERLGQELTKLLNFNSYKASHVV